MYETAQKRWSAVQHRDPAASSAFVFAVKTTGIFCRPTCPARLARRANVDFYDDCAAAIAAGYRACKRCKPEQSVAAADSARRIVDAACTQIQAVHGHITLAKLAQRVRVSPRHLHHVFGTKIGCSPAAYAASVRQRAARHESDDRPADTIPSTADLAAALGRDEHIDWTLFECTASPLYSTVTESYDVSPLSQQALTGEEMDLLIAGLENEDPFDVVDFAKCDVPLDCHQDFIMGPFTAT